MDQLLLFGAGQCRCGTSGKSAGLAVTERIIAWVATQRGRRVTLRYLGVAKNHACCANRAAAINLRTLVNAGLTRCDAAWALA